MTIVNMVGGGAKPDAYYTTSTTTQQSDTYKLSASTTGGLTVTGYTCTFKTALHTVNVVNVYSKIITVFNVGYSSSSYSTKYSISSSTSTAKSNVLSNIESMTMTSVASMLTKAGFKDGDLFKVTFGVYTSYANTSDKAWQDNVFVTTFKLNGSKMEYVSTDTTNSWSLASICGGYQPYASAVMTNIEPIN